MHNRFAHSLCTAVISAAVLLTTQPVSADYTRVTFTATLNQPEVDSGSGAFSGLGEGATVSGEFRFGAGDASPTHTWEYGAEYYFSGGNYGVSVTGGGTEVFDAGEVWFEINNDYPLSADDAAFVEQAFGLVIAPGTQVDTWSLSAESADALWDDTEDCLISGVNFELILADADGTMYDDTSFRSEPPAQGDVELYGILIEEAIGTSGCDNTVYLASGILTDIQYELVDEPDPQPANTPMPWIPILLEE